MVQHIENTKTPALNGVYFDDIEELVSSRSEAWLVYSFLWYYFSTKDAALAFIGRRQGYSE